MGPLSNITGVLIRRDTETHRESMCDYGSRDWSAVSTGQRILKDCWPHRELAERHGKDSPLEFSKSMGLWSPLILDF